MEGAYLLLLYHHRHSSTAALINWGLDEKAAPKFLEGHTRITTRITMMTVKEEDKVAGPGREERGAAGRG